MLQRKFVTDQILRFSGMPGWGNLEKQAKTELADTLLASVQNEYHARRTVDNILAAAQWLPTPAEIRNAADSAPIHPDPPGSGGCDACGHSGRVSNWYIWTAERYPSGMMRGWTKELIPCPPGKENLWLMYEPDVKISDSQQVRLCSGYCTCGLGQRLKAGALQRRHEENTHA